jgi:hypothetical protein
VGRAHRGQTSPPFPTCCTGTPVPGRSAPTVRSIWTCCRRATPAARPARTFRRGWRRSRRAALLRHGPQHTQVLLDGLTAWLDRKGFSSLDQVRGILSVPAATDGAAYERSGYLAAMRRASVLYGPGEELHA